MHLFEMMRIFLSKECDLKSKKQTKINSDKLRYNLHCFVSRLLISVYSSTAALFFFLLFYIWRIYYDRSSRNL